MKYILNSSVLILSFLFAITMNAQQNLGLELKEKLRGKQTFADKMRVVDSLYDAQPERIRENGGNGLVKQKHWKRWAYEMSRSLGRNGQFVNRSQMIWKAFLENPRPSVTTRNEAFGRWTQIGLEKSSYSNDTLNNYPVPYFPNSYANGIGRVDRIAFHPTDKNTYYIATPYGGLWRTLDDGLTWSCLTDHIPSIGVSGIVIDRNNPNILYILTGTADYSTYDFTEIFELNALSMGVMKSTDGGVSWNFTGSFPLTSGVTDYITYDLVQDYRDPNVLLAATSDGIFRTADGGGIWTKVKSGHHFDLEFNRRYAEENNLSIVYTTTKNSIFWSGNGGITWTESAFDYPPSESNAIRGVLATSYPGFKDRVVVLFGGRNVSGTFEGVYRSDDGGLNFTLATFQPNILGYSVFGDDDDNQAGYDLCIAISPAGPNTVVAGGINVWKSTNMNTPNTTPTFSAATMWYENQSNFRAYIHPDQHDLKYNPLNARLFSCNDGGLYRSSDDGATWTNLSKGLYISQFYHLAQSNLSSYKYVGGLQDNGIKYRAKGTKDFTHMTGADGFSTSFSPHNPDIFYMTRNTNSYRMKYSDGSQINGSSWEFYPHILAHPVDTNIVFVGGAKANFGPGIWKSTDQGATFTHKGGKGSWALAIAPSDPNIMYAAGGDSFAPGNGGVYKSINAGETWTLISSNPGFPLAANYNTVTDIAIDPSNPLFVFVSVGGFIAGSKIFYSADGGSNWINLSNNLPNIVAHSVAVVNAKIYVGTDISLFRRDYSNITWFDIGDNLPYSPITEILPDTRTGKITIATFGRGVWERAYCVTNVTLTEDLEGQLDYQSSNIITSSSLIPGNDVDAVTFKAGGKVVLSPGFQATKGAHFEAKTDGCVDGPLPSGKVDSVSKE